MSSWWGTGPRATAVWSVLLASLGCGVADFVSPPANNELVVPAVQLVPVTGSTEVVARTFAIPRATEPDVESGEAFDRCTDDHLAGRDVLERLPVDYAMVRVSPDRIDVAGRTSILLDAGRVEAADQKGMMVMQVYDDLLELAELAHRSEASGCHPWSVSGAPTDRPEAVLVIIDAHVPFETLGQVLYTAGQAAFVHFAVVVDDASPRVDSPPPVRDVPFVREQLPTVSLDLAGARVFTRSEGSVEDYDKALPCDGDVVCPSSAHYDLDGLRETLTTLSGTGTAAEMVFVMATADVPSDAVIRVFGVANEATGNPVFVSLSMQESELEGRVPVVEGASTKTVLTPSATLPVVFVRLVPIGN